MTLLVASGFSLLPLACFGWAVADAFNNDSNEYGTVLKYLAGYSLIAIEVSASIHIPL
jgi:hypothetical protein